MAQVGEGELIGGRIFDGDCGVGCEVAVDVEQLSGGQGAPVGVVIHAFAGDYDRWGSS
jgi:hypothetical protein